MKGWKHIKKKMLDNWPQNELSTHQNSSTRHLFVYEEVWLEDLVPLHTNTAPITLQFSMEELQKPVHTHPYGQSTLSRTHQDVPAPVNTYTNSSTTCSVCSCKINNNIQEQPVQTNPTLPSRAGPSSNSSSRSASSNKMEDGWLSLIRSTLQNRPRGRPRISMFKVEFTEHVFSQLCNGKVENKDGLKVKNRIIGKHLYQNIKRRKTY